MLTIDRSTITDGGMTLLNSGNPVNITSIKTGSGTYTSSEDIVSRTTLKSQMYSYTPSTVQVDGSSRTVSGLLSNYDPDTDTAIVTSDYTITEVGLFATVNGSDVLFAIGVSYDGTEVPAFTGQNKSEIVVEWAMGLSGTDSVTVTATGALALAADLNAHIGNDVYSANGVHGIRAVDDSGKKKLQVDDNGWEDVDGGHTIVDENGTEFTQRAYLKILNAEITDDSENDTTIVNPQGGTTIVTPPTVVVGTYTYNGSPQGPTITWDTGMSDYCVVTNATQTDAGSYQLTIALKNTAKMVWNDGASGLTTADKIYNYSIAKANQTITLSSNSVTLDADHLTADVTVSGAQGAISVVTSDNTIATASVSGSTVTISNVNETSGSATITVSVAGTANYNAATDSTISVTASFYAFPDEWLISGGLNPSSYADLDAVLADETALRRLFTIHDSVDHLVTHKTAIGTTNLTTILNNGYCAKWINLRDYALDTLYADSTLAGIMDTADKYFYGEWAYINNTWQPKGNVPIMTSNTAPYGTASAYQVFDGNSSTAASATNFSYQFTNPVCVKRFTSSVSGGTLQGSNDGSTWTTISTPTSNTAYYLHYRVHYSSSTTVHTIQFYGRELKVSQSTQPTDGRKYLYVNSEYYTEEWGQYDWDTTTPRKYLYDHGLELETLIIRKGSNAANSFEKLDYELKLKIGQSGSDASSMAYYSTGWFYIDLTNYSSMIVSVGDELLNISAIDINPYITNFPENGAQYNNNDGVSIAVLLTTPPVSVPNRSGLNISSINGYKYVGGLICYRAYATMTIKELWLE